MKNNNKCDQKNEKKKKKESSCKLISFHEQINFIVWWKEIKWFEEYCIIFNFSFLLVWFGTEYKIITFKVYDVK